MPSPRDASASASHTCADALGLERIQAERLAYIERQQTERAQTKQPVAKVVATAVEVAQDDRLRAEAGVRTLVSEVDALPAVPDDELKLVICMRLRGVKRGRDDQDDRPGKWSCLDMETPEPDTETPAVVASAVADVAGRQRQRRTGNLAQPPPKKPSRPTQPVGGVGIPEQAHAERMRGLLVLYREREGHCDVPIAHEEEGAKLGDWLSSQRKAYKLRGMSEEKRKANTSHRRPLSDAQVEALEALGVVWEPQASAPGGSAAGGGAGGGARGAAGKRDRQVTTDLGGPPKKGGHRWSSTLTPQQLTALMAQFKADPLPDNETREKLARDLSMSARSVKVWFQNRRVRDLPASGTILASKAAKAAKAATEAEAKAQAKAEAKAAEAEAKAQAKAQAKAEAAQPVEARLIPASGGGVRLTLQLRSHDEKEVRRRGLRLGLEKSRDGNNINNWPAMMQRLRDPRWQQLMSDALAAQPDEQRGTQRQQLLRPLVQLAVKAHAPVLQNNEAQAPMRTAALVYTLTLTVTLTHAVCNVHSSTTMTFTLAGVARR